MISNPRVFGPFNEVRLKHEFGLYSVSVLFHSSNLVADGEQQTCVPVLDSDLKPFFNTTLFGLMNELCKSREYCWFYPPDLHYAL